MSTPQQPPLDRNRIVIETPLTKPKSQLKDRIKIDPFRPGYKWPVNRDPVKRA